MGVSVEVDSGVAVVTLRWPERRNALGPQEAREVTEALTAAADSGARALVLTGEGAFCAGGDLRGMVERAGMSAEDRRKLVYSAYQGLIRALIDLPMPTIAALDGPAVGMGFDIALACDTRIVGAGGWARQGWGRIGVVPGTGGIFLLRHRAPGALWRMLPGQPRLDGPALAQLGLAEAADSALELARDRAARLAEMPWPTLAAYVELDRHSLRTEFEAHLDHVLQIQVRLLADPDFAGRAQQALNES